MITAATREGAMPRTAVNLFFSLVAGLGPIAFAAPASAGKLDGISGEAKKIFDAWFASLPRDFHIQPD
jgi:hypothetical protein